MDGGDTHDGLQEQITPAEPFEYDYRGGWVFVRAASGEFIRVSESRVTKAEIHDWLEAHFEAYTPRVPITKELLNQFAFAFGQDDYLSTIERLIASVGTDGDGAEGKRGHLDKHGRAYFSQALAEERGYLLTVYLDTEQYERTADEMEQVGESLAFVCRNLATYIESGEMSPEVAVGRLAEQVARFDPLAAGTPAELTGSSGTPAQSVQQTGADALLLFISDELREEDTRSLSNYPAAIQSTTGEPLTNRVRGIVSQRIVDATEELVSVFDGEAPYGVTRSDVVRAGLQLIAADNSPVSLTRPLPEPTGHKARSRGEMTEPDRRVDVRVSRTLHDKLRARSRHHDLPMQELCARAICAILELYAPRLTVQNRRDMQAGLVENKSRAHTILEQEYSPLTQLGFRAS